MFSLAFCVKSRGGRKAWLSSCQSFRRASEARQILRDKNREETPSTKRVTSFFFLAEFPWFDGWFNMASVFFLGFWWDSTINYMSMVDISSGKKKSRAHVLMSLYWWKWDWGHYPQTGLALIGESWWFMQMGIWLVVTGTWLLFLHILGIIIPTD